MALNPGALWSQGKRSIFMNDGTSSLILDRATRIGLAVCWNSVLISINYDNILFSWALSHTHPDSYHRLHRAHDAVPMRLLRWEYSVATECTYSLCRSCVTYSISTLKGTLTCSSHMRYETCVASRRNLSGCVLFYLT